MKKLLLITLLFIVTCSSNESMTSKFIKAYLKSTKFAEKSFYKVVYKRSYIDKEKQQPEPDIKFNKKYDVKVDIFQNRNVYIISPKNKKRDKAVLYLHGGAYMANFLPMHWEFIDKIINETGVTVIAPDYPLAPESNWFHAFRMLADIQTAILDDFKDVIFMGDSSGAGLALSWTMELNIRSIKKPKLLILLSPWLDVSMSNPKIKELQKNDPMLNWEALEIAGKFWAGDIDTKNWHVSPIYGNLNNLPPISVFTGTSDILNQDSTRFNKIMIEKGNRIEFYQYENMIHNWMFFSMRESKECFPNIVRELY